MKRKRINPVLLVVLILIVLYAIYLFLIEMQVPMDSDFANQVLEGNDILSGNVLLHGWNLTGITFYLTELPFYVLSAVFSGISTRTYITAIFLTSLSLFLSGWILTQVKDRPLRLEEFLFYLGAAGMPLLPQAGAQRGHSGIFICSFLSFFCIGKIFESEHKKKWLIFYLILTACGCMSDITLLVISVVPVLIYCGVRLLQKPPETEKKWDRLICLADLGGTAVGIVLDRLLIRISGINKNGFLSEHAFLDVDTCLEKFVIILKGILLMFKNDFSKQPLFSLNTLRYVLMSMVLLLTLRIIIETLRGFFAGKFTDAVSILLAMSLTLMTLACYFTNIYLDNTTARYIAFFPGAAAALLIRWTKLKPPAEENGSLKKERICLSAVFVLLCLLSIVPPVTSRKSTPQDRLAAFLEENGLTDGYSDYWNASNTTVASKNKVRLRAVEIVTDSHTVSVGAVPESLKMLNWYCKTDWYRPEYANFIAFDASGEFNLEKDYLIQLLGEPDRILIEEQDQYRVYVYERGIQDQVLLNTHAAKPAF